MLEAAQFGYEKDFPDTSDSKYLKLLIEYGGDVNKEQKGSNPKGNDTKYTPLMIACDYGLFENVKVLIDAGANINYKNGYGQAALQTAVITQRADVVLYLLKKGAVYNETMNLSQNLSRNFYITDILRDWTFELGSEKYKKKMEIVDWLAQHGMSYRNTPIPKNLYGLYSKDYLNNY